MAVSKKLLFGTGPVANESLVSYLIRLAELNLYTRMSWIGSLVGLGLADGSVNKVRTNLGKLTEVVDVQEEQLTPLFHYSSRYGNHSHVSLPTGEIISRDHLSWPASRMCFYCAAESGYISRLWDLKCVTHCPIHGTCITEVCPSCGERATLDRGSLLPCIPGCPLKLEEQKCGVETFGLMRLLSNKFMGTNYSLLRYGFPKELVNGDISIVLQSLSLLLEVVTCTSIDEGKGIKELRRDDFAQAIDEVSVLLSKWPKRMPHILKFLPSENENQSSAISPRQEFGFLYRRVRENQQSLQFFFDALVQHVNGPDSNKVITKRGSPSMLEGDERRLYVPARSAGAFLGMGRAKLKHLYNWGHIQGKYVQTGYGKTLWVNRESLEQYAELQRHLVRPRELALSLNVSRQTVRSLRKANVLPCVHGSEKDGWHVCCYDKRIVSEWLEALKQKCVKANTERGLLSLKEAVFKFNKQGLSYGKLLTAIDEGVLTIYLRETRGDFGLSVFRVRETQLVKWYGPPEPEM